MALLWVHHQTCSSRLSPHFTPWVLKYTEGITLAGSKEDAGEQFHRWLPRDGSFSTSSAHPMNRQRALDPREHSGTQMDPFVPEGKYRSIHCLDMRRVGYSAELPEPSDVHESGCLPQVRSYLRVQLPQNGSSWTRFGFSFVRLFKGICWRLKRAERTAGISGRCRVPLLTSFTSG